jgi:outer membrane lipoprotein-sorting protein
MIQRIIFILLCMAGAGAVKAQNADALIKQVKDKLEKVQDYRASAILKTNVPFIRIPESEVDVYYKRPDKFRIKKEGGVSVLPKGGVSINLNSLLAGNNFTAVPGGDVSIGGQIAKVIKLLPMDESNEVVLTTLYIDDKKQLIRKATTTTRDNGTYEMEMEYGKYADWGLPDKVVFTFNTKNYSLPKGMTLDYEGSDKPPVNKTGKETKGRIEIKYNSYIVNKGVAESVFK